MLFNSIMGVLFPIDNYSLQQPSIIIQPHDQLQVVAIVCNNTIYVLHNTKGSVNWGVKCGYNNILA